MKKPNKKLTTPATLRRKAENLLKSQQPEPNLPASEADTLKLIHELQVHQIELEMQNEELLKAKERAELAEERYEELYDFSPSGYLSLSRTCEITEINFAAARMLGKERSKLLKSRFDLCVSVDQRPVFDNFFIEVFSSNTKQNCEVMLSLEDQRSKHVRIDGIINQSGEQCLLTMVDVTEKMQKEKELIVAKEHAEESERLKSAFLANMSHEIRTPMNGILGFADLLKDPEHDEDEQREYIQIIEKSGIRMLNIINDIIDISKIESGLMKTHINETNLNDQLHYIYTFFKPEAETQGMTLIYNKPLPVKACIINTDREKVYAILTNLVKNAIKYSRKGTIEMGCINKGDVVEFFVSDSGIGIPKEKQKSIFERFIQADRKDDVPQQGVGLGLAISKAYAEMLGGSMWVESEEGKGSTFYFTIRKQLLPEQKSEEETVAPDKETASKKLKIIVADDDETSTKLLSNYFRKSGHQIIPVSTGLKAIESCRKNPDTDLVLMDIQMPEMDGYRATKKIRQFNKDVIIIAQTAYGFSSDKKKAMAAGCNDYIAKPIKKVELLSLIGKYV